jgi:hypothetical protein
MQATDKQVGSSINVSTCIQEVSGLHLSWDTDYLDFEHGFPPL